MQSDPASRRSFMIGLAVATGVFLSARTAGAQSRERVKFARGNDNTAVNGSIKGDGYKDYILGAKAGQQMGVSLITDGGAYFNILPPGSNGEAIYNSSIDGNDATNLRLPSSGDYTVRVYQMGNAADTGVTTAFTLSMTIM